MNSKTAHNKLKEINASRGVGTYRNSRREKNVRHEQFNEAMTEMNKISSKDVELKGR